MRKSLKKAIKRGDEQTAKQIIEAQVAANPKPAKIESQEDILKDIRELLRQSAGGAEKLADNEKKDDKNK